MNVATRARPAWFPDWSDRPCALVGSGPSVTAESVAALRGRMRVLVINTSYQLSPWADALYACDAKWWDWHKGVPDFTGLKIAYDDGAAKRYGLHRIDLIEGGNRDSSISLAPGLLGRGGNSGFQAFNLLLQFGARKIALLGIDFCGRRWHGAHPNGHQGQSERTLSTWRETFDAAAPMAATLGADVINLSEQSALRAYAKMSADDMLKKWGLE